MFGYADLLQHIAGSLKMGFIQQKRKQPESTERSEFIKKYIKI
jgi:hypothetical protein